MGSGGGGGSSGDESSTSQPLLSKHFPPPPSSIEEFASSAGDGKPPRSYTEEEPIVQYQPISFLHGHRLFRDLPFLILFLLFVLSTFAFGIFAVAHRNPHSSNVSSFSFDPNTTSCVKTPSFSSMHLNSFLVSSRPVVKDLIWTLVITLVLSFPITLLILWLLRNYAKQIVYVSIPFFVLIPAFFNVYWFVACALSSSCREAFGLPYRILVLVFVFLVIGIIIWIIVANWHRVELTVRIVQVAAATLARNIWLFAVLPLLTLSLVVYFSPIVVFLVFSRMNGDIMPKEKHGEYYCAWKQDAWVPAYFALAILTMLWSLAAMVEAQVYVISGTVAQWYFSPDGEKPHRSIRSSLRHAFGRSFGTVCFSGLIMFAVRIVRAIVDTAKRGEGSPGIVNLAIQGCARLLLSAIEFLNKFTINFAAITGEAYCSSAKMTYELLKRNLLSAVFVETVSTRILIGIIFVISAIYGIVVCVILKAVSALGADVYFVAVLAWVLLIVVLGFFVHVLDNVIDTIYVCYAIDRDQGEVCKPEVHEVYVLLPISRTDRPSLANRTPMNV